MSFWGYGMLIAAAAGGLGLMAACDDKSSVPQAVIDQATTQATDQMPARPTTQELLSGPRTSELLTPLPLRMQIPKSWGRPRVITSTTENILEGATPAGDISISKKVRPSITKTDFDRLIAGAKKEMQQNPDTIKKADLRPLPNSSDGKLFERQSVGQPGPYTTYDAQNIPHTSTQSIYKWTLMAFVPHADAYQVYELNFIGLTKEQFEKDQEFLNSIINTLSYATVGDSAPPTATPASAPAAPALP
jgi:hypothetical protein